MGWLPNRESVANKIIYDLVSSNPEGLDAGEIYEAVNVELADRGYHEYSTRAIYDKLRILVEDDLIDGRIINRGCKGRTTRFYPNQNTEKIRHRWMTKKSRNQYSYPKE